MKNTELSTFENSIVGSIRGFTDKNGNPWFLAGQVCRCLGIKNSSQAVEQIKQRMNIVDQYYRDKKGVFSKYTLLTPKTINIETSGGIQKSLIIPENYLYELIFASRKQTAVVFRAWVTSEVLPALRKHGEYRMEGKLIRRSLTDTIQTEIVDKSNSDNEKRFAYSNFTKLINKSLGLPNKVDRNSLPDEMLEKLARREDLVRTLVAEGKSYKEVKHVIETNFGESA